MNCNATALQTAIDRLARVSGRVEKQEVGVVLIHGCKVDDEDMLVAVRHALAEGSRKGDTVDLSRVRASRLILFFAGSQTTARVDLQVKRHQ
jgi:hypothetical protein